MRHRRFRVRSRSIDLELWKEYTDDLDAHCNFRFLPWASSLHAASQSETAVFSAFKQTDAALSHFIQLQRTSVTEELDLIVAMGSQRTITAEPTWFAWNEDQTIGLFLQEKARPERVYLLGTKTGFPDCSAGVERVTATNSVISCQGEKSARS